MLEARITNRIQRISRWTLGTDTFDVGSVILQVGITKPDGVNDMLALRVGNWLTTFDQKTIEHLGTE